MEPALSRRLARIMPQVFADLGLAGKEKFITKVQGVKTFADLPKDIQHYIEHMEANAKKGKYL